METARNNKVTNISQFSRERQGGGQRTPLDDCRETSVLGLKLALDEALEQAKLKLLGMAEKAMGLDLYHLYMDTLELARDHRAEIGVAFRKHYLQRFNRECRRNATQIRKDANSSELSLQAPDDLEESLAADSLANAIRNAGIEELFGLNKRMGLLIDDPELAHGVNPLGPEVISESIMAALNDQDSALKTRLLMATQLSKHLPERIGAIYQDINRRLVRQNVLPTIRTSVRRAAPDRQPDPQIGAEGGDVFALLRQLMAMGGGLAAMPAGPMTGAAILGPALPGEAAAGMAAIRPDQLMPALNQLQRGRAAELEQAGLDDAVLDAIDQGRGQVNVLHGLRNSRMAGAMTAMDAMTLDIVAMVFDYVLEDTRIPDAIKALIGRLQIPVLKVAMLDKTFFSQKSHPARKLLDALAEAAIGWDAGEGHEGGLYRKIEELVEAIVERFDDRIEVFAEALEQLNAFLAEERRAAAAAMAPSVQAVQNIEQAAASRRAAHDEVQSSLLGHPLPTLIGAFLTGPWQRMLADIHYKAGEDSAAWKGALGTMADLIWSVAAKVDRDERKRLVAMLPSLLRRLDEAVSYVGMDQQARDAFFTELVKCHAEAVKDGRLDEDQVMPQFEASALADSDLPELTEPVGFEPVAVAVEPAAEVPALIEELAAASEENIVGEAPDMEAELGRLKRGCWIEYRQDDGASVRAKLSWVSPLKGLYLFTNRHGQRAISINAEGLAAKLRAGEVHILNAAPLMDRAVGSLMERLQRHAA